MADFNHGIATVIKEIKTPNGIIQPGSIGQITAYLPEEDKFGVYFTLGGWITFDKYSLDQYCEIELSDDYKNN